MLDKDDRELDEQMTPTGLVDHLCIGLVAGMLMGFIMGLIAA